MYARQYNKTIDIIYALCNQRSHSGYRIHDRSQQVIPKWKPCYKTEFAMMQLTTHKVDRI